MEKAANPRRYVPEILVGNAAFGFFPSLFKASYGGVAARRCRELCAHQHHTVRIRISSYCCATE
jgi:hypothetical protein